MYYHHKAIWWLTLQHIERIQSHSMVKKIKNEVHKMRSVAMSNFTHAAKFCRVLPRLPFKSLGEPR